LLHSDESVLLFTSGRVLSSRCAMTLGFLLGSWRTTCVLRPSFFLYQKLVPVTLVVWHVFLYHTKLQPAGRRSGTMLLDITHHVTNSVTAGCLLVQLYYYAAVLMQTSTWLHLMK